MKPRLNVMTLAVNDLDASHAFYRDGLGWPSQGILGEEFTGSDTEPAGRVAFFEMPGGLIFALYPRTELAKDANRPVGTPNAIEFSLGYAVSSPEKVDEILQKAKKAGAALTDKPHERPWGIYSGYFQDLDGHLWEIIYNPGIEIDDE